MHVSLQSFSSDPQKRGVILGQCYLTDFQF